MTIRELRAALDQVRNEDAIVCFDEYSLGIRNSDGGELGDIDPIDGFQPAYSLCYEKPLPVHEAVNRMFEKFHEFMKKDLEFYMGDQWEPRAPIGTMLTIKRPERHDASN